MSDETQKLDLPPGVSAEEWSAARKELLVREKAFTKGTRRTQFRQGAAADGRSDQEL
jgi:predicted dithiol-disulfide oxidoreductase (DUF899 family)